MSTKVIIHPTSEPVSLLDIKKHLRVDDTEEDSYLQGLIVASRQKTEVYLQRALITQTVELYLYEFPGIIEVPKPVLQAIESIKYIDGLGVLKTIDSGNYYVDSIAEPACIYPIDGFDWPLTMGLPNSVIIRFVCGFGDETKVPQIIKQAILLTIGFLYNTREDHAGKMPKQAENLIHNYRVFSI